MLGWRCQIHSQDRGFGVIGELETALSDKDFIKKIKEVFGVKADEAHKF